MSQNICIYRTPAAEARHVDYEDLYHLADSSDGTGTVMYASIEAVSQPNEVTQTGSGNCVIYSDVTLVDDDYALYANV